jgi:predicted dehydrogenase
MRPVRFGFWGAGAVAADVASDLAWVTGAELHAVAARDESRARAFAASFGARRGAAGLRSLLDDPQIDVVYVATPNHRHADDAIACLEAGKAVLCEKPFALDRAGAERVVETARRCRRFCMEAMWTRFVPAVQQARRLVACGALGTLRYLHGDFAYPASREAMPALFDVARGGGALLDRGVYLVSLAQWLLGTPSRVHASAWRDVNGVDLQISAQLEYDAGASASLMASLCGAGRNEVTLVGESGTLRLCEPFYRAHRIIVHRARIGPRRALERQGAARRAFGYARRRFDMLDRQHDGQQVWAFAGHGYHFELAEVVACVRAGVFESSIMPLAASLETLSILDRIGAAALLRT